MKKYRAIRRGCEDFTYWDYVHTYSPTEAVAYNFTGIHNVNGHPVYPETVGRCINLKDNKGRMLYENDIVYVKLPNGRVLGEAAGDIVHVPTYLTKGIPSITEYTAIAKFDEYAAHFYRNEHICISVGKYSQEVLTNISFERLRESFSIGVSIYTDKDFEWDLNFLRLVSGCETNDDLLKTFGIFSCGVLREGKNE